MLDPVDTAPWARSFRNRVILNLECKYWAAYLGGQIDDNTGYKMFILCRSCVGSKLGCGLCSASFCWACIEAKVFQNSMKDGFCWGQKQPWATWFLHFFLVLANEIMLFRCLQLLGINIGLTFLPQNFVAPFGGKKWGKKRSLTLMLLALHMCEFRSLRFLSIAFEDGLPRLHYKNEETMEKEVLKHKMRGKDGCQEGKALLLDWNVWYYKRRSLA